MKPLRSFILILLLGLGNAYSQSNNLIENPDTSRRLFPVTHGTKKWKPHISLDANRSFYEGKPIKLNGARIGAEYLGTHRFGIGYYWLGRKGLPIDLPVELPTSEIDTSLTNLRLFYGTLFYERVFFKSRRWEIAIPSHLGVGGITETQGGGQPDLLSNPSFFSISSGMVVKFYILSWLAPHVGLKYRYLFNSEPIVRQAFSAPYYSFGLKISIGDFYRNYFSKKKKK